MPRLKKPRTSFTEWLRERRQTEFLKDVSFITNLIHFVCSEKCTFDASVKAELVTLCTQKLSKRVHDYRANAWRWDGRNWGWYHKIIKRIDLSEAAAGEVGAA